MMLWTRRSLIATGAAALTLPTDAMAQQCGQAAHYVGALEMQADPNGRYMHLLQPYEFIDACGTNWLAPAGATVDGASIPRALWTVVGGPWDGTYRNASVIHDWFCAVRVRPWRATHAMFYEAMIASGVDRAKAYEMWLAVYLGGPRWDDLTIQNNILNSGNGATRLVALAAPVPPPPPAGTGLSAADVMQGLAALAASEPVDAARPTPANATTANLNRRMLAFQDQQRGDALLRRQFALLSAEARAQNWSLDQSAVAIDRLRATQPQLGVH